MAEPVGRLASGELHCSHWTACAYPEDCQQPASAHHAFYEGLGLSTCCLCCAVHPHTADSSKCFVSSSCCVFVYLTIIKNHLRTETSQFNQGLALSGTAQWVVWMQGGCALRSVQGTGSNTSLSAPRSGLTARSILGLNTVARGSLQVRAAAQGENPDSNKSR